MELHIAEWGNSLAIRIPKAAAKRLRVKKGSKVKAEFDDDDKFIISHGTPKISRQMLEELSGNLDLDEMVSRITDENRPDRAEFEDAPVGREIW